MQRQLPPKLLNEVGAIHEAAEDEDVGCNAGDFLARTGSWDILSYSRDKGT